MFNLKLFGGAVVEGPDGPLSGRIAQRRQLALLAYLSLQGERPTSRDKLLSLFWPESDSERARHNLADGVYLIRKALGDESVLSFGDDVLLSRDAIRSDAARFDDAVDAGELKQAVELYAGPFLDGFHLPDSREFEDWLSRERERLARAHLGALEALAEQADTSDRPREAAEWWRKAAAVAPDNSRVALGLMRALAAAGDRAGAIRWAGVHRQILQEDLGIDPDPALVSVAQELRDGFDAERNAPEEFAEPGHSAEEDAPHDTGDGFAARRARASGRDDGEPRERDAEERAAPRKRIRVPSGVGVGLFGGIILTFLAAALYLGNGTGDTIVADTGEGLDPDAVVVVPFRTAGASPEVDYLGQGMMELLAAKLSVDGSLRVVGPGIVLAEWRNTATDAEGEPSRTAAVGIARNLGAANLIMGSVVGTRGALSFQGTMIDTRTGETTAEGTVHGTEDARPELVDRLAAELLVRRAGEEEHRLAHLTSASPAALTAWLHARAAHRRGSYEEALSHYARALDLDSTFALAGRGINQIAGWVGGTRPLANRANRVLRANLDRLSERDRAGFVGRLTPRDPDEIPSVIERVEALEETLRRWPDHPLLWHRRGDLLMHLGQSLELPSWEARTRESFERAMELDPDYAEPVHHLAVVLGEAGDTAALRALAEEQLARTPSGPTADHLRWRAHHNLGEASPFRPPPLEAMDTDATLRWIGIEAQDYGFALDDGARAVRLRVGRPGIRDEHLERRQGAFAYALNQGRPSQALSVLESIREVQSDPHFHLRIGVLTALYADGDEGAAERAAAELARAPTDGALGELNLCILAQWRLAQQAGREGAADAVELPPEIPATNTTSLAAYRVVCSAVARAQQAALVTGRAGGPATRNLDSILALGRYWALVDDGHFEFAHVALARLHEAAGSPHAALRALRRRVRYHGWQPYLATTLREEARLAVSLGDTTGAIGAYEHYLAFRTDPEPALRADVERVRAELAELRSEATSRDQRR